MKIVNICVGKAHLKKKKIVFRNVIASKVKNCYTFEVSHFQILIQYSDATTHENKQLTHICDELSGH